MAKVLIVEDDTSIRTAYAYAMARAGFKVAEAADGVKAAAALESERPDVVLLDMLMPGMSGLEFLTHTRISSRFPATKVIAVSNIDTPRVVDEARKLGVVEYVIKVDTTPHQMVDLVNQQLKA
jgi:DNA-binding NtrC family response regulator